VKLQARGPKGSGGTRQVPLRLGVGGKVVGTAEVDEARGKVVAEVTDPVAAAQLRAVLTADAGSFSIAASGPESGVFTTCVGGCSQGAEFDGLGGVCEPGWTWFDDPEGEWESGWQCPDCRAALTWERIAELPYTAWTFPA
jgi:hypothetical protein